MKKESHTLIEVNQFFIKEKDRPNFNVYPYCNMIMNNNYVICESKIFYLYNDKALGDGILDMEELSEIQDAEVLRDKCRRGSLRSSR